MASHVIVNLLRPLAERTVFYFKMDTPAEIILFLFKTICHWNVLFHAKIIVSIISTIIYIPV